VPTARDRIGTWAKVALGVLVGIGIAPGVWPYSHGCGLRLIFYLLGVTTVIAAGVWASTSSWKRRLGFAHVVSQILIVWGILLMTREVLPRVGERAAALWLCPTCRCRADTCHPILTPLMPENFQNFIAANGSPPGPARTSRTATGGLGRRDRLLPALGPGRCDAGHRVGPARIHAMVQDARAAPRRGAAPRRRSARATQGGHRARHDARDGKVLAETRGDVQEGIDTAHYAHTEGRRLFGRTVPSELRNKWAMSFRRPIGVAGLITPFNFPLAIRRGRCSPRSCAGMR